MAYRRKNINITEALPEGGYANLDVLRTMSVSVEKGLLPVVVRGYGINEARFATLEDVYKTFCCFGAPIRLDDGGCDVIMSLLEELGFERPTGYFT